MELQPSKNPEQVFVNNQLISISKELTIPYIITTDSHYLKKEDALIHEKYLNSQDGDREVKAFYETTYMMSTEELESFFPYLSKEEIYQAYDNIEYIKNQCQDYSIQKPLRIPSLPWLDYPRVETKEWVERMPSLNKFLHSSYKADNELVYAVIEGINKHPDLQNQEAYDALEECLNMTWISAA